jgi:hypothetical protein
MLFHRLTKLNLNSEKKNNLHSFPQIIAQLWIMFPLRHGQLSGNAEQADTARPGNADNALAVCNGYGEERLQNVRLPIRH